MRARSGVYLFICMLNKVRSAGIVDVGKRFIDARYILFNESARLCPRGRADVKDRRTIVCYDAACVARVSTLGQHTPPPH